MVYPGACRRSPIPVLTGLNVEQLRSYDERRYHSAKPPTAYQRNLTFVTVARVFGCAETWYESKASESSATSAGAVSGLVLLLIVVVMTTVLALVWRRYRIKARQRRLSQLACESHTARTCYDVVHTSPALSHTHTPA